MPAPFRSADDPEIFDLHRARDIVHARFGNLIALVERLRAGEVEDTEKTIRLNVALAGNAIGDLLRDLTIALGAERRNEPGTCEGFLAAALLVLPAERTVAGAERLLIQRAQARGAAMADLTGTVA